MGPRRAWTLVGIGKPMEKSWGEMVQALSLSHVLVIQGHLYMLAGLKATH